MTKREEAAKKLDQVEDLCVKLEMGKGELATKMAVLILARAVWWLLERYLKEDKE